MRLISLGLLCTMGAIFVAADASKKDIHCMTQTNLNDCITNSCHWCADSRGMGAECVPTTWVPRLSVSKYTCVGSSEGFPAMQPSFDWGKLEQPLTDDPANSNCTSFKSKAPCDDTAGCIWCKAAAVPSECVPASLAKHLPPGVFQCS